MVNVRFLPHQLDLRLAVAELGISYFSSDLEIAISLNVADVRAMDFVMGLQVYRVFVSCTKAISNHNDRIYMFQRWRFPAKRALRRVACARVESMPANRTTRHRRNPAQRHTLAVRPFSFRM